MKNNFNYIKQKVSELSREKKTRLVLVYNPRSTSFYRIEKEVLSPARKLVTREGKGIILIKYEVKPTNVDDNSDILSQLLRTDDIVVSAGGDATATIAVNAIAKSGLNMKFWALPYGNFSDTARLCLDGAGKPLYPLEMFVNGEHYRFAACYFTLGLMAEATEIFDSPSVREHLQTNSSNLFYSARIGFSWWCKNHKRDFIPSRPETDIFAVNSPTVARLMKGGDFYRLDKSFLTSFRNLSKFWSAVRFVLHSLIKSIPGEIADEINLDFETPISLEVEAEGEYKKLSDVKNIKIIKSNKSIEIL